jgi:hypothetical protein
MGVLRRPAGFVPKDLSSIGFFINSNRVDQALRVFGAGRPWARCVQIKVKAMGLSVGDRGVIETRARLYPTLRSLQEYCRACGRRGILTWTL